MPACPLHTHKLNSWVYMQKTIFGTIGILSVWYLILSIDWKEGGRVGREGVGRE